MTTPTVDTTASLARKLAEVMAAVGRIPKRGYNEHFKYQFVLEADVLDVVRKELSDRKIILIPQILSVERTGANLTQIAMRFTFMDGETLETIDYSWFAQGQDTQDKGISKAATSGEKYFLLKAFLIPTGDDPDQDGALKEPKRPAATATRPPAEAKPDLIITAEQGRRIKSLMKAHNTHVDEFKAWVKARFHVTDARELRQKHYEAITRYIIEGIDITTGEAK